MKINRFIFDSDTQILHDRYFTRYGDVNCCYSLNAVGSGTAGTFTLTANTLYAFPFIIDQPLRIEDISTVIQTAVGGTTVRLAVYRDGGNFYPGKLVPRTDQGTLSSATTGVKTNTFEPMKLIRGIYWAVIQSNGAPAPRSQGKVVSYKALGFNPTTLEAYTGWQYSLAYAASPGIFPKGATLASNDVPHFFFKTKKP
jgi:hypothetical protein